MHYDTDSCRNVVTQLGLEWIACVNKNLTNSVIQANQYRALGDVLQEVIL